MAVLSVRSDGFVRSDFRRRRPSRPRLPRGLRGRLITLSRRGGDPAPQCAEIKLDDVRGPVSLGRSSLRFGPRNAGRECNMQGVAIRMPLAPRDEARQEAAPAVTDF